MFGGLEVSYHQTYSARDCSPAPQNPRPSAKGAHSYRKQACLEALRLAITKLTQRGTGSPAPQNPRPSAKGAHRYRKRACLEALRLATTKLTQRGTPYPTQNLQASTGLIHN